METCTAVCCIVKLNFILMYDTKKLSFFCSNKDPVPENLRAHVIYEFQCPGCKAKYIGKTDRCLGLRLDEHSHAETSAIGKHLNECEQFHFIVNLYNISIFQIWTRLLFSTIIIFTQLFYRTLI